MLSINKGNNGENKTFGDLYDSSHGDEHVGAFGGYVQHPSEPEESIYNPENLFDDSNSQNATWIRKARAYLAMRTKF